MHQPIRARLTFSAFTLLTLLLTGLPTAGPSIAATASGPATATTPVRAAGAVSLAADWERTAPVAAYNTRMTDEAFSSPAVGDVTGDSQPEIVVGSNSGRILIFDLSGNLVRSFATDTAPNFVISSPALADLNNDGKLDIVVGLMPVSDAAAGITMGAFTGQGQRLWGRKACGTPGKFCDIFATPAIGDVNGDGRLDVVLASQDHWVYALNGADGSDLAGWPRFMDDTTWSSAALADLNGDGHAEVIVASDLDGPTCTGHPELQPCSFGGLIRVYNDHGVELSRYNMPGETPFSSPAVGDVNGDGHPDIVVGSGFNFVGQGLPELPSRRLWAFDGALHPLPGWPVVLGGRSMASPALVDLDGNGKHQVVTTAEDGTVEVWNSTGTLRWSACNRDAGKPCNATNFPMNSSPVVADINGDGHQEVLAASEQTLRAFDAATGAVRWESVLWQPALHTFANASTPTVVSVNGHARVFVHGLIDANFDQRRDVGDADALWSFSAANDLGPSAWPMFRHDTFRGGSVVPLPAPLPIDQTPAGKYVIKSFHDLLGRAPSSQELPFGVNTVLGLGRVPFEQALVFSHEWAGHVVHDLYATVIGREPDPAGLEYWTAQVQGGRPARSVAAFMYGSTEYYQAHGNDPSVYVSALYSAILGRAPEAAGVAYWADQVGSRGLKSVAADFYQSLESRRKRVVALYQQLLRRTPDDAGRDYWAGRLLPDDDLALAINLTTSDEYYLTPLRAG